MLGLRDSVNRKIKAEKFPLEISIAALHEQVLWLVYIAISGKKVWF